jgi:hypothetical protein
MLLSYHLNTSKPHGSIPMSYHTSASHDIAPCHLLRSFTYISINKIHTVHSPHINKVHIVQIECVSPIHSNAVFTHGGSPLHCQPTAMCPCSDPHHHSHMHSQACCSARSPTWGSDGLCCGVHHPHNNSWWCSHSGAVNICIYSVPHLYRGHNCATWGILCIHGWCHPLYTCHNRTLVDPVLSCDSMCACCTSSLLLIQWGCHR